MHSTKKIVCSVFVVMVALGLGGYLGLADAALAERDLTDAEMAGITGKGPDPVVACDGCYLETIGALCNLVDPCMCVVGQNTSCSFDSRIYKGFSTVNRFRNSNIRGK